MSRQIPSLAFATVALLLSLTLAAPSFGGAAAPPVCAALAVPPGPASPWTASARAAKSPVAPLPAADRSRGRKARVFRPKFKKGSSGPRPSRVASKPRSSRSASLSASSRGVRKSMNQGTRVQSVQARSLSADGRVRAKVRRVPVRRSGAPLARKGSRAATGRHGANARSKTASSGPESTSARSPKVRLQRRSGDAASSVKPTFASGTRRVLIARRRARSNLAESGDATTGSAEARTAARSSVSSRVWSRIEVDMDIDTPDDLAPENPYSRIEGGKIVTPKSRFQVARDALPEPTGDYGNLSVFQTRVATGSAAKLFSTDAGGDYDTEGDAFGGHSATRSLGSRNVLGSEVDRSSSSRTSISATTQVSALRSANAILLPTSGLGPANSRGDGPPATNPAR